MKYAIYQLLFFTVLCFFFVKVLCDDSRVLITVEHSFVDSIWKERGKVSFRNRGAYMLTDQAKISKSVQFQQNKWSSEDIVNLNKNAENNGLYKIRVKSANEESPHVIASVRTCQLFNSNFNDKISIHLDHQNNVISLSYRTNSSLCEGVQSEVKELRTSVSIDFGSEGPEPNLSALRINEEIKKQREEGSSQGFFSRYWYIIVPVVIGFLVLNLFVAEPEKGPAK
eukprot:TRINITY_DN5543_c0_g2_i1.p1 TRINITY_DN5543_c0_g2~~TRINITY_DN5543_c0_g2_i1.p1  ORF type:complete len:226 (+),score=22.00 TRINITY_DN5543_c0_g2_i1:74-751(+)